MKKNMPKAAVLLYLASGVVALYALAFAFRVGQQGIDALWCAIAGGCA